MGLELPACGKCDPIGLGRPSKFVAPALPHVIHFGAALWSDGAAIPQKIPAGAG